MTAATPGRPAEQVATRGDDARSRLRRVGVVIHPARRGAPELATELAKWALDRGIQLFVLANERDCLGNKLADVICRTEADFADGLDLVVALGGDGTLLRAARLCLDHDVPVLGVNLGRLGFLTEVEPRDLGAALESFAAGRYTIEARMTLQVDMTVKETSVPRPPGTAACGAGEVAGAPEAAAGRANEVARANGARAASATALAVNDVVLEKAARHRLAGVAVRIDGHLFASYAADGLIASTPTGSTAYSFSAGGPIVAPQLDAIMLTPIAPHMVFNRCLVLHPDSVIRFEVLPGSAGVDVTVDGNPVHRLLPGAVVEVRKASHRALLVRLDHTDFFHRVRTKFQLADAGEQYATGVDIDTPPPP
jgi:NAD+ kinase